LARAEFVMYTTLTEKTHRAANPSFVCPL